MTINKNKWIIGSRASTLALTQTNLVASALRAAYPGLTVQIKTLSTQGDRVLDVALSKIGDKGLFVKELEVALLHGEIDLAVHSAKDLPSQLPDGLALTAFLPRGDVRDALVVRTQSPDTLMAARHSDRLLAHSAQVGTSSLRRMCQLRALQPDLRVSDVRGNVDTRLRKLAEGQFDALVLATAGLQRLGFMDHAADGQPIELTCAVGALLMAMPLPTTLMLPAVAQGALAIQSRTGDDRINKRLRTLNDATTQTAVLAERAFLRRLEGGCQVPIAGYAQLVGDEIRMSGLVGALDGRRMIRGTHAGDARAPEGVGNALAERLLDQGGQTILAELRAAQATGANDVRDARE